MKPLTTAIIIPAYNEEQHISGVIETIPNNIDRIIVVDDCSSDATGAILAKLSNPKLIICTHAENRGVGAAIVTGYQEAIRREIDICVVMGGDGQMDPGDIQAVIEPVKTGQADYSKGTRFRSPANRRNIPIQRRMGIRLFTWLTRRAMGGVKISDAQCGFTAASRKMLQAIPLERLYPGYGFPNDMLLMVNAAGYRICEVPVKAIYADEQSGIKILRDLPRLLVRLVRRWLKASG